MAKNFQDSASSFHLDGHDLVAELQNGERRLNLNQILGNEDGHFQWEGVDFTESANNIRLNKEGDQPILRAKLQRANGGWREADVNLAERIGNLDGELCFE